jgi:hypothetical protein
MTSQPEVIGHDKKRGSIFSFTARPFGRRESREVTLEELPADQSAHALVN